jgi:hypothetical protein
MPDGRITVEVIENIGQIEIDQDNVTVNIEENPVEVTVGFSGPQGPKGDKGDPGEVQFSDLSYVHNQVSPEAIWTINHNLGFIPNITVVESSGDVVEGSYNYSSASTVVLTFIGAFSGKAYLS